jgi:signal transduction histidine kinase
MIGRLSKANQTLEESVLNREKVDKNIIEKLLGYYRLLDKGFHDEHQKIRESIRLLYDKVRAIISIVEAQQQYATVNQLSERLSLLEIVEQALEFKSQSMTRHHIELEKLYISRPEIFGQKHKLIHVLLNLYENAKEAMHEKDIGQRKLSVRVDDDAEHAYLRITDTGCGIAEEHFQDIFMYGFTTKADGHGFGLHSCCNYLKEMNGEITVTSPGIGKGATFCLVFPLIDGKQKRAQTEAVASST